MKKGKQRRPERKKMNHGLDPDKFEICVPRSCKLLKPQGWYCPKAWCDYLKELDPTLEAPQVECCESCDCKPGWRLRGELALEHARRVHEQIHRQVLAFENVSAVDVGFAIWERRVEFGDFLAIRVHVNQKRPPEQLFLAGLASFTAPFYSLSGGLQRFLFGGGVGGPGIEIPFEEDAVGGLGFVHPDDLPRAPAPWQDRSSSESERDPSRCEREFFTQSEGGWPPCEKEGCAYAARYPCLCDERGHATTPCEDKRRSRAEQHPSLCKRLRMRHCSDPKQARNLWKLLERELRDDPRFLRLLDKYPISGVREEDLSIFCPERLRRTSTLDDIRLCICGVPLDIINARYSLSVSHPGGDAVRGVFAEPSRLSNQIPDDEHLLIGRGRVSPLVGGVSVGTVTGQAGTLGTVVWDRTDGTPCVLSNWHVLAGDPSAQVGQAIYQPALFDGGTQQDVVARLKRWRLNEDGDAAIAELTRTRDYATGEILGLWHPVSGYLSPKLNMEIRKWGRSTGFTQGFIDGIYLATNIDYGSGLIRYFKDQVHIAPLHRGEDVSQVGDSGSLVVTRFKPVEQARELKALRAELAEFCQLLRTCCESQKPEDLYHDIISGLEDLCRKCPCDQGDPCSLCQHLCDPQLREYISCLCAGTERRPSPPFRDCDSLCDVLCQILEWIKYECRELHEDIACSELYLESLRRKYRNCCQCDPASLESLEREDTVGVGSSLAGGWEFQEICDKYSLHVRYASRLEAANSLKEETLANGCESVDREGSQDGSSGDPGSFCQNLLQRIREVDQCLEYLQKFATCCELAECSFEDWLRRCRRIEEGKKLCEALDDLDDCYESEKKVGKDICECPSRLLESLRSMPAKSCDAQGAPQKESGAQRSQVEHEHWIDQVLRSGVTPAEIREAIRDLAIRFREQRNEDDLRDTVRAYYAVGMIFAGDTPGSPFGEFAVASPIAMLAEELRISLRPVYEPRSSFRELRERPGQGQQGGREFRSRAGLVPGAPNDDPRGSGPQPDPEPAQTSSGSGPGGGS